MAYSKDKREVLDDFKNNIEIVFALTSPLLKKELYSDGKFKGIVCQKTVIEKMYPTPDIHMKECEVLKAVVKLDHEW